LADTIVTDEIGNKIAARSALLDFYSDRAASFGGFFLASLFGLLAMLTVTQSIKCPADYLTRTFVGLSLVPFLAFALIGYYTLRQFSYYADIANTIEGGTEDPESLRAYAKLGAKNTKKDCSNTSNSWRRKILALLISHCHSLN